MFFFSRFPRDDLLCGLRHYVLQNKMLIPVPVFGH
ncbi:hypothetical protein TcasGA2_TC033290 [Tribolium castaneum]|uniref:Uncharacterized protein n=1 Tax=Tribolium castaneum TaxID=7070 RepID=A0A139WA10_TRICA|nr:hypothetical protein TcasGA2_TC033290 [Tribolium castaneum]